jgi:hypothetical protein
MRKWIRLKVIEDFYRNDEEISSQILRETEFIAGDHGFFRMTGLKRRAIWKAQEEVAHKTKLSSFNDQGRLSKPERSFATVMVQVGKGLSEILRITWNFMTKATIENMNSESFAIFSSFSLSSTKSFFCSSLLLSPLRCLLMKKNIEESLAQKEKGMDLFTPKHQGKTLYDDFKVRTCGWSYELFESKLTNESPFSVIVNSVSNDKRLIFLADISPNEIL